MHQMNLRPQLKARVPPPTEVRGSLPRHPVEDHAQVELVFAEMPNLVRRAQERHQVIALSRYLCGPYGDGTTTFEAEHLRKLRSVGINLGDPLELPTHWCADPHAVYLSGMIQSEQDLKGPVLAELLASLPSLPPAILFVDDREMQCRSVAETAETLQIPCLCIHLDRTLEGLAPLDEELAERQMHSWVYEHAWLSDAEAQQPVRTTN